MPRNASELTLTTALKTIALFLREKPDCDNPLILFLGVDEYQKIDPKKSSDDDGSGKSPSRLNTLLEVLADTMLNAIPGLVILPLFAGTDLKSTSPANSSSFGTKRIPVKLLTHEEIERAVGSSASARALALNPCRRHLFFLGGVPRYPLAYINCVNDLWISESLPEVSELDSAYDSTVDQFSLGDWGDLSVTQLLFLTAYSVVGQPISLKKGLLPWEEKPRWSRLRDSSVCLIDEKKRVSIPYCVMRSCGELLDFKIENRLTPMQKRAAEKFIETLHDLAESVDNLMYDNPPWMLWEKFGAYFHALRINALVLIGKTTALFSDIVLGALISGCKERVRLRPVSVVKSHDPYGSGISKTLPLSGYPQKTFNWVDEEDGYIVLNAENGAGVDIFFALKREDNPGYVVCVDQRKRVAGSLGPKAATTLLEKANILPVSLRDAVLVRGLCSLFPQFSQKSSELPNDCFVLSYSTTSDYHQSLGPHPAASPCVNINFDNKTTVKMVTNIPDEVVARRSTKLFQDIEELREFVEGKGGKLKDEERILF